MSSAIIDWNQQVAAHHEQSQTIQRQSAWEATDFWEPFEAHFKADPHRAQDPVLDRLRIGLSSQQAVLDVGGGAGRFALPLTLTSEHVTVVEPSASMVQWLRDDARNFGLSNLSVIQQPWEEAAVEPHDMGFCAYVLHGVAEIKQFVDKLIDHAKRGVVILEHMAAPDSMVNPVWRAVHGEERKGTPGVPELLKVLWEMEIYPEVQMFEGTRPTTVETREQGLQLLRHLLYVEPGTEQDRSLHAAMDQWMVESPGGLTIRGAGPGRQALMSWKIDPGHPCPTS